MIFLNDININSVSGYEISIRQGNDSITLRAYLLLL